MSNDSSKGACHAELLVITPYSDSMGYCSCYKAKLAGRNALAGKMRAEQVTLAMATAAFNTASAVALPNLAFVFRTAGLLFVVLYDEECDDDKHEPPKEDNPPR